MKFQKRKVENDDLIKPLLSQMKAEASCSKPTPVEMKSEGYKSAFPARYRRRSTVVRQAARRKGQTMDGTVIKRLMGSDVLSDDSTYSDFSIGHSVSSIESTERASNYRRCSLPSIKEEYEELDNDEYVRMTGLAMLKMAVVVTATIASVAFYAISFTDMFIADNAVSSLSILGAAGGISLLLAPWVCVKELRLARYPSIRNSISGLRVQAKILEKEIQTLQVEVVELQSEAARLDKAQCDFNQFAFNQDINSTEILDLVHENKNILAQMQDYLRKAVLQNVIKEILRCDKDGDGMLNRKEAAVLATSIQVGLSAYGIVFDVDKFHRAVGLSPSLISVVAIVKRLLPDQDGRLSSFYSTISDTVDESTIDEDDGDAGLFDMFYMPVRRAFETMFTDTLYVVKGDDQASKYMSLSPVTKRPSVKLLKDVATCPECLQCPYCIAKPKNTSGLDMQKSLHGGCGEEGCSKC